MNNVITDFLENGRLPAIEVNVTIDNNSLLKIAGVLVAAIIIGALFHAALSRHAK